MEYKNTFHHSEELFHNIDSVKTQLSVILLVSLVSNGFTESFSHRYVCLISPWNLNGHFTCPLSPMSLQQTEEYRVE